MDKDTVWCDYHGIDHDLQLIKRFSAKYPANNHRCPIELAMEIQSGVFLLEPEYTIIPKICTEAQWPQNIDLLITKLPATEKNGFSTGLVGFVANRTFQNMNNNSLAFIIMSSFKEQKDRPHQIIEIFKQAGFQFIDTIVWEKNKFIPTQGAKRLNNVYDFIFMFSKGDNYHLDRESVAYLKGDDENYLCPGNVWKIKIDEKDTIPQELTDCIIKLAHLLPNSLIVDPFMDTGNILKSVLDNKHSFWGCESNTLKFKRCQKVIKDIREKHSNVYLEELDVTSTETKS